MDTPQPQPTNTEANIRKAAEAIAEVLQMKQEFIRCHEFLSKNTSRLVELLGQAGADHGRVSAACGGAQGCSFCTLLTETCRSLFRTLS
jgi:hypothetical protein